MSLSTSLEPVPSRVTVAPSATDWASPASQTGASSTAATDSDIVPVAESRAASCRVYVNESAPL